MIDPVVPDQGGHLPDPLKPYVGRFGLSGRIVGLSARPGLSPVSGVRAVGVTSILGAIRSCLRGRVRPRQETCLVPSRTRGARIAACGSGFAIGLLSRAFPPPALSGRTNSHVRFKRPGVCLRERRRPQPLGLNICRRAHEQAETEGSHHDICQRWVVDAPRHQSDADSSGQEACCRGPSPLHYAQPLTWFCLPQVDQ